MHDAQERKRERESESMCIIHVHAPESLRMSLSLVHHA
jgi:hypothetical protein